MGRKVDPSGLTTWAGLLDQGLPRPLVVTAIEDSAEFRAIEVEHLYNQYLHRAADPLGLDGATAFLQGGGTMEQLATVLIGSTEYFQNRGGGTNSGFLQALYLDALNRPIDPTAEATITPLLANGTTTSQVATLVLHSQEYAADLVQSYYRQLLNRDLDATGQTTWPQFLRAGAPDEVVTAYIIGSDEYFARIMN
jgi:hypothetical protein